MEILNRHCKSEFSVGFVDASIAHSVLGWRKRKIDAVDPENDWFARCTQDVLLRKFVWSTRLSDTPWNCLLPGGGYLFIDVPSSVPFVQRSWSPPLYTLSTYSPLRIWLACVSLTTVGQPNFTLHEAEDNSKVVFRLPTSIFKFWIDSCLAPMMDDIIAYI